MGLDARVRYTKMVIRDSFIDLVAEKPFHRITLKEVCDRAEINRSTFYRHYRDTYDWKEQTERAFVASAQALLVECDVSGADDVPAALSRQFESLRKDERLFRMVASPNFESSVMEQIVTMVVERADEEMRKRRASGDQADYLCRWDSHYLIKGCLGAMECWVADGMREAPEELARFMADKIYSSGACPQRAPCALRPAR